MLGVSETDLVHRSCSIDRFRSSRKNRALVQTFPSKGVNERIERFAKIIADIEAGKDLFGEDSPLQLSPPEQFAFYERLDGPIYDTLSAKARTPIILRLDSLLSDGGATYDFDVITVEHVLPQTPKSGSKWLEWFPDQVLRSELVHRLGNLALLSRRKNSQASNWDFDRKKESYFRRGGISPFVMTTQVLDEEEWLPSVIKSRQKSLVSILDNHWRLEKRKPLDKWLLENL